MVVTVGRAGNDLWLGSTAYLNWLLGIFLFLGSMHLVEERRGESEDMVLAQSIARCLNEVDGMLNNRLVTKEDALMKVRQDLCVLMQHVISEPHKTSFALPQTVDYFMDDFVVRKVEDEVEGQLSDS
eukprot:766114-Hanusia_phi.AAC.2